jgi:SHAQKYF class myb-like DNA-binding protein
VRHLLQGAVGQQQPLRMAEVGVQQVLRGGMRPNYSSNSLAAAEQLGALMSHGAGSHHVGVGQEMLFGVALGEQSHELPQAQAPSMPSAMAPPLQQHYPHGSGMSRHANPFVRPGDMQLGGGCHGSDRLDFPSASLHMHPYRDAVAMNAVLRQADHAGMLGAMHPGMGAAGPHGSLSMMGYPCGVGGVGSHVGGMNLSPGPMDNTGGEYQQKRRFVWTPDLHQRFEAACNQLGLDNAKPKSILRLMNVDGLTKANIKSHLQKYRCMMQKRSAADSGGAAADGPPAKAQKRSHASRPAGGDESSDAAGDYASEMGVSLNGQSDDLGAPEEKVAPAAISGPIALQQNLEVQEETLLAQMELQQQLTKQLQMQKRLQSEMEMMMQSHNGTSEDDAASTKMNAILQMKQKLELELQVRACALYAAVASTSPWPCPLPAVPWRRRCCSHGLWPPARRTT